MPEEEKPFKLTHIEAERVKASVLAAAATGALSGAMPVRLVESLMTALALVSKSADAKPERVPAPWRSLSLVDRLALARRWLLGRETHPLQERAMGADRWQLEPPAEQRMRVAVAAALRELADGVLKQGRDAPGARALLADVEVSDREATGGSLSPSPSLPLPEEVVLTDAELSMLSSTYWAVPEVCVPRRRP